MVRCPVAMLRLELVLGFYKPRIAGATGYFDSLPPTSDTELAIRTTLRRTFENHSPGGETPAKLRLDDGPKKPEAYLAVIAHE
jgi:hypothetical protein